MSSRSAAGLANRTARRGEPTSPATVASSSSDSERSSRRAAGGAAGTTAALAVLPLALLVVLRLMGMDVLAPLDRRSATRSSAVAASARGDNVDEHGLSGAVVGMRAFWHARVFTYPNFLSDAEVEYLVAASEAQLTAKNGQRWRNEQYAFAYFEGKWEQDAVVNRIEERIASLLMVPVHSEESRIMIANTAAGGTNAKPNVVRNIHHDQNTAENRFLTVLIYLTDVAEGGDTVFPCHAPADSAGSASSTAFMAELQRRKQPRKRYSVTDDLRETFARATIAENRRILYDPSPPHWNTTAWQLVADMCNAKVDCLRVRPQRGLAVVFPSKLWDGSTDETMWHAGCPVKRGAKLTLQKFKELPRVHGEWRAHASWTKDDGSRVRPSWHPLGQEGAASTGTGGVPVYVRA